MLFLAGCQAVPQLWSAGWQGIPGLGFTVRPQPRPYGLFASRPVIPRVKRNCRYRALCYVAVMCPISPVMWGTPHAAPKHSTKRRHKTQGTRPDNHSNIRKENKCSVQVPTSAWTQRISESWEHPLRALFGSGALSSLNTLKGCITHPSPMSQDAREVGSQHKQFDG